MNIPRRELFGKLNLDLFRAIESATALAKLRGNPYVEMVHWLHQLWQIPQGDFQRLALHYGMDAAQVEKDLTMALAHLPHGATGLNDFGHAVEFAIERAWLFASLTMRDHCVRGAWLLGAMLQTPELRRLLLGISASFQRIGVEKWADDLPQAVRGSAEEGVPAHERSDCHPAVPGEASGAMDAVADGASALGRYCTDLTSLAREGGIDPVVGREQEIRTMVDILLRRRQNNPLLTGEAGVGKTAVVEGLARAIATGQVPPSLRRVRLLGLDVGALLAGASMRGEFESRLKTVLKEASASDVPVILFVDEVHTLIGAGGQAGTGDAANLLKPALARGAFRVIGATTWSEYKRHIEKDPALTRRFQMLQVLEPQAPAAAAMVRGLVPAFAKHHGVAVLDEAVQAAVTLSHRYLPSRQLPDKAISLLDTACARVAMSLHAPSRALEVVQARRQALQDEHALLQQEASMGKDRTDALADLQARIREAEAEHQAQLAAGAAERRLTQTILEKRAACGHTEDGSVRQALASELRELEAELRTLQGDRPGVHTQVDEGVVASSSAHRVRAARNPDGLVSTLARFFGVDVHLQEYMLQWMPIEPQDQCVLGLPRPSSVLGEGAMLGEKVPDRQSRFRLVIGPLDLDGYLRLTPQGAATGRDLPALVETVRSFIGFEYVWEVELLIDGTAAPCSKLGDGTRLGWSTWMAGDGVAPGPVVGMVFEPESYFT